ncbi:MAG TPA: DUF5715 family protein [Acidobacteriaceae bacterium]|nr:DUF5715 family protein [Acidobacteriaceae bacterium]
MMMTQWGHAPTEEGARVNKAARTAMWITVWSVLVAFVMFCAVGEALAETYTPHTRRITARYTTAHYVTHGKNVRSSAASVRARGRAPKFEPVRESASSRRASSMHRASSRRRVGERHHRSERLDVVAGTNAHADSAAEAALSVHDGVSVPAMGAGSNASAEVSAAQRGAAPMQRSAPSDLVGAPLTATARPEPRSTTTVADGGMPLAAREDLAEEAGQPVVLPGLYRYGRLVVQPPMRGTREILVHQNMIADEEGLSRIQDDEDLRRMRTERMLVDFPETTSLHVNAELAGDRRCARPWTVRFAGDIARAYYARFHQPLQVNSAVRTVAYQLRLRRVNGNAAGIGGEMASPHLTGEALDFGKHDMSTEEIAWMRAYLRPLMQVGKVDVEEEFQQACFHISVYRSYAPDMPSSRREVAQLRGPRV